MKLATRREPSVGDARRAAFQVLLHAVRGSGDDAPSSLLRETTPSVLLAMADYHGVSGVLYDRLRQTSDGDRALLDELERRSSAGALRHVQTIWALSQIQPHLDRTSCQWAVIKGPVVVESLYEGRADLRGYGDLDLLVHPEAFSETIEALTALGAVLLDRNWRMLRRDLRGEVHLAYRQNLPIDLHWDLVNMYRGRMAVDTAGMLRRTIRVKAGRLTMPGLSHTDATLHLALHAALSGGDKLMWLMDIERSADVWRPDWAALVDRARAWNVGAPVGVMLERARTVLGAKVPPEVPTSLTGYSTRLLERLTQRLSPWQYALGRTAAPARLFARSIGHGVPRAAIWILWRSLRNLDPSQEWRSSTFRPAGNERDRAAFEASVAEWAKRRR